MILKLDYNATMKQHQIKELIIKEKSQSETGLSTEFHIDLNDENEHEKSDIDIQTADDRRQIDLQNTNEVNQSLVPKRNTKGKLRLGER